MLQRPSKNLQTFKPFQDLQTTFELATKCSEGYRRWSEPSSKLRAFDHVLRRLSKDLRTFDRGLRRLTNGLRTFDQVFRKLWKNRRNFDQGSRKQTKDIQPSIFIPSQGSKILEVLRIGRSQEATGRMFVTPTPSSEVCNIISVDLNPSKKSSTRGTKTANCWYK